MLRMAVSGDLWFDPNPILEFDPFKSIIEVLRPTQTTPAFLSTLEQKKFFRKHALSKWQMES